MDWFRKLEQLSYNQLKNLVVLTSGVAILLFVAIGFSGVPRESTQSQSAATALAGAKVIFLTSGSSWSVPADWNDANNTIEVIGAGADGTIGTSIIGGGGGAYSQASNVNLGGGVATYSIGTHGGDTWFNASSMAACQAAGPTSCVGAKGGSIPAGGSALASVGTTKYSGGDGGSSGGGGGGAGGPNGNGAAGGVGHGIPDYGMTAGNGAGGGGGGGGYSGGGPYIAPDGNTDDDGNPTSAVFTGPGGNNFSNTPGSGAISRNTTNYSGGGVSGSPGTIGGGGSGGSAGYIAGSGGAGGAGIDWDSSHGSGGGGGAGAFAFQYQSSGGGDGGLYGGGGGSGGYPNLGGSGGGGCGHGCGPGVNGLGGQGLIRITYVPQSQPSPPVCGNGIIESGEACDLGASNGSCSALCTGSCTAKVNTCAAPNTPTLTIGGRDSATSPSGPFLNPIFVTIGEPITIRAKFTPASGDSLVRTAINDYLDHNWCGDVGCLLPDETIWTTNLNQKEYTFTPGASGDKLFRPVAQTDTFPGWNDYGVALIVTVCPSGQHANASNTACVDDIVPSPPPSSPPPSAGICGPHEENPPTCSCISPFTRIPPVSGTCQIQPTIVLFTPDQSKVRSGFSANLNWKVTGLIVGENTDCAITSNPAGVFSQSIPKDVTGHNIATTWSGSHEVTGPINITTTFTLSCTNANSQTRSVGIIPAVIEI